MTGPSSWERSGCYSMAAYNPPVAMILKCSWKKTHLNQPHGCLADFGNRRMAVCICGVSIWLCFPLLKGWMRTKRTTSCCCSKLPDSESPAEGSLTVVVGPIHMGARPCTPYMRMPLGTCVHGQACAAFAHGCFESSMDRSFAGDSSCNSPLWFQGRYLACRLGWQQGDKAVVLQKTGCVYDLFLRVFFSSRG